MGKWNNIHLRAFEGMIRGKFSSLTMFFASVNNFKTGLTTKHLVLAIVIRIDVTMIDQHYDVTIIAMVRVGSMNRTKCDDAGAVVNQKCASDGAW